MDLNIVNEKINNIKKHLLELEAEVAKYTVSTSSQSTQNTKPSPIPQTTPAPVETTKPTPSVARSQAPKPTTTSANSQTPSTVTRSQDSSPEPMSSELPKSRDPEAGAFDGKAVTLPNGERHEVPANYAAKSKLVYGDILKIVMVDGKKLFKIINKIPSKEIEGILTQRGGSWMFVGDSGTYDVSDVAAEFNKAEDGDEAVVIVPTTIHARFAALERVVKETNTISPPTYSATKPAETTSEPKATLQHPNNEVGSAPSPSITTQNETSNQDFYVGDPQQPKVLYDEDLR